MRATMVQSQSVTGLLILQLLIISNGLSMAESPSMVSTDGTNPRGYGEPCTCDRDCDLNQWLNCQEGTCLCLSSSFQYDHARHSCVVRLGHKCFEVAGEKYADLPYHIRCVEGAFCSIALGGLCACNTYGYYEVQGGDRCEQRKEFGSKCGNPLECKTDACSGGVCSCREGQYYDVGRDKCLGVVGSYCFTDAECTMHAICSETAKCSCGPGFAATSSSSSDNNLTCAPQLRLGANCSSTTSCNNPSLACFKDRCDCAYPGHQLVDENEQACKSLVASAPCVHDTDCVVGASCVHPQDGTSSGLSECLCAQDLSEMEDGTCALYKTFGAPCSQDEECDPVTPLLCKNSICQCSDSLTVYDPEARLCRGLHGFRGCTGDKTCTKFATCVQYNVKLPAKCVCQGPEYKPNGDRSCIPV